MTFLRAGLAGIAALAIAGPLLVIANPPTIAPPPKVTVPRARVVPKAELPPVEPVQFVALAPQDARAFNAFVRQRGGEPASPARYPRRNLAKSLAWRAMRRTGIAD